MKNQKTFILTMVCIVLAIVLALAVIFLETMDERMGNRPAMQNPANEQTVATTDQPTQETVEETQMPVEEATVPVVNEEVQEPVTDEVPDEPKPESNPGTTVQNPSNNPLFPGYKYDSVFDMEDNIFIDALVYTGYNLEEHKADGKMWQYVLAKYKKGYGWLSNITFGGGSTGLETTAEGLPDIKRFEKGGLVCATFASYVYFNYLPNVAKIDVSSLDLPADTKSANSFYQACKKWLAKGYTYNIGFTATNKPGSIKFEPDQEIPIGSIILFRDLESPGKTTADHVTIYVGERNGYHWVIQTGNKNGPEFCAVERFKFGPDPQWPLAVFATPTCIYDGAGALKG